MTTHHSDSINEAVRREGPAFLRFLRRRFRRGDQYGLAFTLAFVLVIGLMWVFLAIQNDVADQESLYSLDLRVHAFLHSILSEERTEWAVFVTDLGGSRGTIVGVVVVGISLLVMQRWWPLFGLVFVTALGGLLSEGLKLIFRRERPIEKVIPAGGYSFPSGHAFAATVFFGYLIYLAWKMIRPPLWRWLAILASFMMILLIGGSRVYLNVHYFSDVVAGILSGAAWLVAGILIINYVEHAPARKRR